MDEGIRPGQMIEGEYRIVRPLGLGGASVVYEALHVPTGVPVAIKVLRQRAAASPETTERFRREMLALAGLHSPHVARVVALEAPRGGPPYAVLELLVGNDLCEELDAKGPLPVSVAVDYAVQAARGLAFVHAHGIIHRDLKPANLYLCAPDTPAGARTVKVIDFGISKMTAPTSAALTRTLDVFGTPEYMSPEQIRATRDVDERTDVWSLGIVLFECLAGRPPFKGSPTRVIAAIAGEKLPKLADFGVQADSALEGVLSRMLERDVGRRLPSADAVVTALAPFAGSTPGREVTA
jgi:serine/threonine protein kinase